MKWYVIHTYSGHENKVMLALEKQIKVLELEEDIKEIRIPTSEVADTKNGKKRVKKKLLATFPKECFYRFQGFWVIGYPVFSPRNHY